MLKDKQAIATVAVSDLKRAGAFYGETLGLPRGGEDNEEVLTFQSGATKLLVYRSEYAGTNRATSVNFAAGDEVDAIAKALAGKGVAFEHYDMPGMTREGDVHVAGGMRVAWFKDPDGNILSLVSG